MYDVSFYNSKTATNNHESTRQRLNALRHTITEILTVSGAPDCTLGVMHHGDTVFAANFGYRDVSSKLMPDGKTRYSINSMTKAIVSMLVGIMVDEGKLEFHTPIKSVLPEFSSCDNEVQENTTIMDLLSHRTGISNFDAIWLSAHNTLLIDRGQSLSAFYSLRPWLPFRTSFLYNNFGYDIIGMVLEKVTGTELSKLLRDRIFKPLGMTRTSCEWDAEDTNQARSYVVLDDLSPFEIRRPQIRRGTIMEAAGGVKSTLDDLLCLYKAFMHASVEQFKCRKDSMPDSIFKHCRTLLSNHARFPGPFLHEHGYAAGWARTQLPGQLGLISNNPLIGGEPIVGGFSDSQLIIYHNGSMPGSTTCVYMSLETETAVVVLMNSLAPNDTADFVGQLLLQHVCDMTVKNDYVALATEFSWRTLHHMEALKLELDKERIPGTSHRRLSEYAGQYLNSTKNFSINIFKHNGGLGMSFQGLPDEVYNLQHYQYNTFSWLMTYNEAAKRGRYIADYQSRYYLIKFKARKDGPVEGLQWAWDPNSELVEFFHKQKNSGANSILTVMLIPKLKIQILRRLLCRLVDRSQIYATMHTLIMLDKN
ncbi:MAG: hypothetical protein M1834_001708 [Cirrosporium novae-zelandiae]|nr:MAG: hypothetical protein M1834_001708 [Cirrosporium novae-zelandiae]